MRKATKLGLFGLLLAFGPVFASILYKIEINWVMQIITGLIGFIIYIYDTQKEPKEDYF